jgi:small-conductance mechanosensitive channel
MDIFNEFLRALQNLMNAAVDSVPKIIGFFAILLFGWILARVISSTLNKVLVTLKVDGLGDKIKDIDIFSGLDFKLSSVLSKIVYWCVLLLGLNLAADSVNAEIITDGISAVFAYLPKLTVAIIFFVVGTMLAQLIRGVIAAACASLNIAAGRIISAFVFYFLLIMVSISALNQAGIDTEIITQNITLAMAAIFFAFAIGYGFASKDIMASVLASFYSRNKFEIGQTIKLGEVAGKIVAMDSTSVTLDAGDRKIVMPLSKLLNSTVEIL